MTLRILGGKFKGKALDTPNVLTTKPITSILRKSLFDSCQFFIENAKVLDLFAGSGSIGMEALSRGASIVYFIDLEKVAIDCIEKNLEKLNARSQGVILHQDAFSLFPNKHLPLFDIAFIHPPYPIGEAGYEKLIHYLEANANQFTETAHFYLETPVNLLNYCETLLLKSFSIMKIKKFSKTGLIHFAAN